MTTWESLKGWFDFPSIYDKAIEQSGTHPLFVEVGVAYGRSINYLATASKAAKIAPKIYAVDLFGGSVGEKPGTYSKDMFHLFVKGVHDCGNNDLIETIVSDSAEAADKFGNHSCDLVFIDASHTYKEVLRDLKAWQPKVKKGGIFAGHDIDAKGVRQAVEEHLGEEGVGFIVSGRSWIAVNKHHTK
jgi:predicted O-methyltransferase YrrM